MTLYFNSMPLIGQWLKSDYNNANSLTDLIQLTHTWLEISDNSNNPVKQNYYKASAYYLYALITGKSYESKNLTT